MVTARECTLLSRMERRIVLIKEPHALKSLYSVSCGAPLLQMKKATNLSSFSVRNVSISEN